MKFIPAAEDNGLIVPIGRIALTEACRQMRRWTETAVEIPDMRVHVNVSERQFFQSDFVEAVDAALRETGLPPWRLCLEITENVYLENVDAALTHLRRLKRLGVRLVTDDFGTGFSSLSLLRRFPLYGIKLD